MTSLFPPRESLVVTSRLGTGNSRSFFYGVCFPLHLPPTTLAMHIFFQNSLLHSIPFLHSALYYPYLHRCITLHSCILESPAPAPLHHILLYSCTLASCSLASPSPAHVRPSLLHYCTTISCSLALLSAVLMHHHLLHPFPILPAPLHHSLIHASTILSCTLYPHCVHFEPFSGIY